MAQAQQITILIPDPDEMMFVAGQNEANIDRIEREFGVKIVARGAELRISGDPSSVSRVGDLVGAMRSLSGRDDNLRRPALERLIGDAKEAPVATPCNGPLSCESPAPFRNGSSGPDGAGGAG